MSDSVQAPADCIRVLYRLEVPDLTGASNVGMAAKIAPDRVVSRNWWKFPGGAFRTCEVGSDQMLQWGSATGARSSSPGGKRRAVCSISTSKNMSVCLSCVMGFGWFRSKQNTGPTNSLRNCVRQCLG